MNGMHTHEIAMRLDEIKDEIIELMHECEGMLRRTGMTWRRAEAYWYGHILSAVGDERYPSGSATSMQETIEELEEADMDEDDDTGPGGPGGPGGGPPGGGIGRSPMGSVSSMRLTNTFSRIATGMDAGQLREHLASELHAWQQEGFRRPEAARQFYAKLKRLAKMIGKTVEEVHEELRQDAEMMGDEEGFDLERTSGIEAKQRWHEGSEYAICTDAVGREDEAKYKRCKEDVLRKHRQGK